MLFLDDERFPIDAFAPMLGKQNSVYLNPEWKIVRNYSQFVRVIVDPEYMTELISFDNDLGAELEGYDCAKFLVDYCLENNLKLPKYLVHSGNTVARENIITLLSRFEKFQNEL